MLLLFLFADRKMSVDGGDDSSLYGKSNDIGDIDDINLNVILSCGAIWLPTSLGNTTFTVTETMLQLLHMREMFGGLAHESLHDHLQKFVNIFGPFTIRSITQESNRLRLFVFSLMGEAKKWFSELPKNIITSLEELIERFFPPSRMVKLRDGIQNFKRKMVSLFMKHGCVSKD